MQYAAGVVGEFVAVEELANLAEVGAHDGVALGGEGLFRLSALWRRRTVESRRISGANRWVEPMLSASMLCSARWLCSAVMLSAPCCEAPLRSSRSSLSRGPRCRR